MSLSVPEQAVRAILDRLRDIREPDAPITLLVDRRRRRAPADLTHLRALLGTVDISPADARSGNANEEWNHAFALEVVLAPDDDDEAFDEAGHTVFAEVGRVLSGLYPPSPITDILSPSMELVDDDESVPGVRITFVAQYRYQLTDPYTSTGG